MKISNPKWKLLALLFAPFFMYGLCSPDNEEQLPDHPNTDEYITFRIPGYNGNMTNPPDSIVYGYYPNNLNVFVSYNANNSVSTYASFTGPQATGTYPAGYFNVFTDGRYFVPTSTPVQITVTSFGAAGQYITGSYSGMLKDSVGSSTYSVSGNFKVRNQ